MTGYQFNKLAGAVLAALLLFFGSRELINIFGSHEAPQKPGYDVPVPEAAEATGEKPAEGEAPVDGEPLGALLAAANVEAGAADAKICGTCHAFEAGAAAKIGPNLHGVVGRDIASAEGFQYSPALSGKEGAWTYEALDAFLKSPKDFAPGTKMVFPGIKEAKKRADLIVYLKSISPNAPELPAADAPVAEAGKEAPAPEGVASEEGKAAEAEEQAAAEEETEQTPAGGEAPQGDPAAPPPGAEAPASPPAPEAPPPPEQAVPAAPAEQPAPHQAEQQAAPAEQPAPASEPQSAPAPESGAPPAAEPAPATATGGGNVEAGMKVAKVCQTCHAFEAGAPAKIGPNLHGVVGRPIGGAEGFQYSPALKDKGGNWDEASLSKFLENPRGFAPGTKMIYPGIKDEGKRADLIAYLKSLSQ